jgi:cobalt-zinc-cadmium efflux system outer membrane protein
MTASQVPAHRAVLGLAAALGCCWMLAADPPSEPRPIAQDTPAFRAPADPPGKAAPAEPLAPEPAGPLALQDALALALMQNPELAAFSWETRAGEARALQAKKLPNPELDVRVYRLGIPRGNVVEKNDKRSRVVLSQEFELGGKRRRRVRLAQAEGSLAQWDYEEKRIEVAADVADRFVEVLGAQRRVDSWQRLVGFLEESRDRVVGLVERGSMRSLEIHQVTRQVGLARIELQSAASELSAARFRLAATWGSRSPRFTEAVGDLEQSIAIPELDTVMSLAQQSPAMARWDAELARGQAALALAKAERVPDVSAGAGFRWQEHVDEKDYLVDVEFALPIFDRRQGDIREARFDVAKTRAERKAAEAESGEVIAELYYELVASAARRTTLGDEVLPAVRAILEAYRAGSTSDANSLEDLIDAQRDLTRAEAQYTDALVDYHQALAAVEGAIAHSLTESE